MSVFTKGIYDRLYNDPILRSKINTYNSEPAIFTVEPVPGNARLPYVVVSGPVSDVPFDTKTTLGREQTVDIRCYTENKGSKAQVEEIAERVRELFHRQSITITGYKNIITSCTGPVFIPEDEALGMVVTVRFINEKEGI